MVDVFISYSRSNQPVVRQLAEAVKRLGYSVWWDDELPPHLSYSDVITDKIGSAKAAIVVWSEGAAASEWVRAEADVARSQKKLIQTSIDGRMPPMPFNQIQFAAIGDWRGEEDHPGWTKVKASLDALCGPPYGAAPLPASPPPAAPARPAPAALPAVRRSPLVPVLIGLLLLAIVIVGYLLWSRGAAEKAPPQNQTAVSAAPPSEPAPQPAAPPAEAAPPTAQPDGAFTEAATIDDPDGFTNVRGGPSADAFAIGRVNQGEVFTTYRQEGDWWRVRTADGTVGYMAHSRIRLISASAPAPAAQAAPHGAAPRHAEAAPAQAAAEPAKPAAGAAQAPVLRMPMNPRRYCNGPGRGTIECEQLRQRYARPNRGGY
jgi:hypothetical protein